MSDKPSKHQQGFKFSAPILETRVVLAMLVVFRFSNVRHLRFDSGFGIGSGSAESGATFHLTLDSSSL